MYEWLEKEEERKVMGDWMQNLVQKKAWVRGDPSFRDKRQKIRTRDVFMRWYAPNESNIMKIVYWLAKILDTTTARKKSSETFQAAITHLTGWMVEKIFSFNVVVTRQELFEFINSIPDDFGITVGKCPCKAYTQEKEGLDGRHKGETEFTCQLPVETDVQIGRTARHYVEKVPSFRNIDKQELIKLENKLLDLGVVPCIYNVCQGETAICNCSPVSCVPLLANRLFGYNLSCLIRQGKYIAVTDKERCIGCGECLSLAVCPFEARELIGDGDDYHSDIISSERCYGCGNCAEHCKQNAIEMVLRDR
ncbi:MAG: 4Fe-4S dicluster domain-containing protein [Candidatus Methanolliviera hydrocarbonicum]|uniref:4Fe-4S dicluster domain-containing protein n=1 Tax=Candidatus Methanolliviera hydrocarbonicum TaxID=2491085 RepID=A0A520KUC7_9EURY|nr:MAG: 4Fe-4S dicluster domain-containing protein [Candidatus Methanolliviera hydrocarbonicum]